MCSFLIFYLLIYETHGVHHYYVKKFRPSICIQTACTVTEPTEQPNQPTQLIKTTTHFNVESLVTKSSSFALQKSRLEASNP